MTSSKTQFEAMFADVQQTLSKEINDKTEEIERLMERIDSLEKVNHSRIEELESRLTQRERVVESLEADLAAVRNIEQEKLDELQKLKEEFDGKFKYFK